MRFWLFPSQIAGGAGSAAAVAAGALVLPAEVEEDLVAAEVPLSAVVEPDIVQEGLAVDAASPAGWGTVPAAREVESASAVDRA